MSTIPSNSNAARPLPGRVEFRTAGRDDIEPIVRIINAAFAAERFFIEHDRIDSEEVRDKLEQGTFLLAEDAGALIGCVYVELRGERGYFGLLSVDSGRQREGIGRALVAAAEQTCRSAGCRAMDLLVVNLRTELPPLYQKFGYVETGTVPFPADVPTKLPCHFLVMSKELVPAEGQP